MCAPLSGSGVSVLPGAAIEALLGEGGDTPELAKVRRIGRSPAVALRPVEPVPLAGVRSLGPQPVQFVAGGGVQACRHWVRLSFVPPRGSGWLEGRRG